MTRRRSTLARGFLCSFAWIVPAALAAGGEIPSPESVLGFPAGADFKLADWGAIERYFRVLDDATERVAVEAIGRTTLGKEMILVVVTSEGNMRRLENLQQQQRALADPRTLPRAQAEPLFRDAPVVLFVGCAQHATEIGSTQMALELAHRLAAGDTPGATFVRENVVLLLVPSLNPDGHQMVCDWYAKYLGTPFEGGRMPWLYHHYVGHDNNRDWAMLTQVESENVSRVLYEEWFPQILIDVHQMGRSGARMFIPPYHDPVNPNMDPLIEYQLSLIGAQMQLALSQAGKKGVITSAMFDEWLLGYFTSVPCRHNMTAQLIEMASVNVASPIFQRRAELRASEEGDGYGRRANFPEPWEGGWWRLRDIVDYELTALDATLRLAAREREAFLRSFYELGTRQIAAGRCERPFAYLVPAEQRDVATAWAMLQVLHKGGIEIHLAEEPFTADSIEYPRGTWVVLMAQPYRAHAKDLLERQTYPELRLYSGGPLERPYDVTGWTLPLLMGVKSVEVVNPFEAELSRVADWQNVPAGRIEGLQADSRYLLVERAQNNAYRLVNRVLAAAGRVEYFTSEVTLAERRLAPGTFIIPLDVSLPAPFAGSVLEHAQALGLRAFAWDELPDSPARRVQPVRLGLYQPWTASMEEGWTRFVLERFEFAYRTVHDAEVRAGGLEARYDVLLLPDVPGESIVRGATEGSLPKEYVGGIGVEGSFALRDFVRSGGTLVAIDSSCELMINTLELPLKQAPSEDEAAKKKFFCPGSILRIDTDPRHPLAYGLPPATSVMFTESPFFERVEEQGERPKKGEEKPEEKVAEEAPPAVVATYPKLNPLMSGWIENDSFLHGKAALVQATYAEGTAVLIGFPCQFRAQTHGTFKVLFNAILQAGDEPVVKE
ncbi:MAG: M14 family metallopeptidase [Planctomycetota bacterium]